MGVLHIACIIFLLRSTSAFRCGPNSHFNVSASACPITCENKDNPPPCNLGCVPRCECNSGFVLDNLGNCIRSCDCRISCGPNSRFNPYASGCPPTCANKELRRSCKKAPVARCECIPGYILNHEGKCIRECDCPSCGPNERFNPTASGCPVTCENRGMQNLCNAKPRPRCECIDGYVLDVNGVCVAEGSCPRCAPNSRYMFCGSACPRTCENKDLDLVCNLKCKPGCVCRKGYVLGPLGNCIKECECPSCPPNSRYKTCASACPLTCANKDTPVICTKQCVARCDCNQGFVLDHEGNCIAERNCPRCGPNQIFNPKAIACPRTCQNPNADKECTVGLRARCQCIRGFILDHEGNCIPERNCPRCGPNQIFNPLASACIRTCQNMNILRQCKLGFKARCQCIRGYVLDHDGNCIPERNCPSCPNHSHFEPHASACPITCQNMYAIRKCTLGFRSRCVCDTGFVLDHNGVCILERNCPRCGPNQVFNPRASACVRTCENKNILRDCSLGFKARCECIRGFVLDHDGNCIPERNCPSCAENSHFEPHAIACVRTCENMNSMIQCTLGFKARCVCNPGFVRDHNGVCILEGNCPRCGPNQIFNPRASACPSTCENPNASKGCKLGIKARCDCIRGFVLDHEGNCIPERNCPRCAENAHFEPRAVACVRTCENMNRQVECTLGFKPRCVCNKGFVLDHNGICIREANCPRCGPNQFFNPRASSCPCTCENPNASKQCKLGPQARCDCIRGFVLDHEGNCIDERNCPRCGPNQIFNPRASACACSCENPNASKECKLGFKARCQCIRGYVLDHEGNCIDARNCPRCGPNQYFNPRASACQCTCENPNASKGCKLGVKARCDCIRGFVLDHEGNCIDERNCPRCQENAHFEPRASACMRTCQNVNAEADCTLGFKARCVCNNGFILDHNGVCIAEANCPRCGPNQIFNPRASACTRTCEHPNADKECNLGVTARCECMRGFVMDHEGNCIEERSCPRCQENAHFEARASACIRTCENMNAVVECTLGYKARCVCDKGFILDHTGVCIREANCPRCGPNEYFNTRASACKCTCENPNASKDCKLGPVARCDCVRGYVLDHNGVCIPEASCPRCGPNEFFNPRASACKCTCENPNANKDCKLGPAARCDCISGYVLDHNGVCIPEANCPRCGLFEVFNPRSSGCIRTCENRNAIGDCSLGIRARCECIPGYVVDHKGDCIRENKCPSCGPHSHFNPKASACVVTCQTKDSREECTLGTVARCECDEGYVLDHNGVCIKSCECVSCGPHSHFNPKASACVVTCQTKDIREECTLGTVARCECDEGYVLDHNGVCIKACECVKCGPHSHFNPKASACPITCDNFDQPRHCRLGLVARCECDHGFVLHPNGNCVEQCDCPVKCPPNSHYNVSASACPINCMNRNSPPICNAPNVARCQCNDGFVLNNKGVCIPECDCQPTCGHNEHFNWCAPVEPITCLNRNSPRPFSEACVARCECNKGFILNSEGKCVKECECKECRPNAHYTNCVSNCPRTCSNLNDVLLCSKECRSGGCECNEGFVFDNFGNCVREHDCPDPRCGRHAFFSHHLPNIQITCANRHQRRAVEFSYCSEGGCRCKNGYVLDGYGNCILESDCPKLMRL